MLTMLKSMLRSVSFKGESETALPSLSPSWDWFLRSFLAEEDRRSLVATGDPVRFGSVLLALKDIDTNRLPGALAECGVYRGAMSKFVREHSPVRKLYLFDTFSGFDTRDLRGESDERFRDTSVEAVLSHMGNAENVIVRRGYFPDSVGDLGDEQFAFVMVDFDKYQPTLAALSLFYPRMVPGGYIFVHDVNSPESDWACSRALNEFLKDKPEKPVAVPDMWGTAIFRKI